MMRYRDRARLLDPRPMALELGFERLDSGVLHIAVRTDMHGCTGAMLDWWFESRIGDREYRWWHPLDHLSSDWIEGAPGTVVGTIHQVEERFTGLPPQRLSIQFRDPEEFFDSEQLIQARRSGAISALFCIRGGEGHDPRRDASGGVIGTRLIHVARDTPWGLALRSHYFMGQDLAEEAGLDAERVVEIFPDVLGPNMLQHCYDEFTYLSRFLPGLFSAEGCHETAIVRPW